MHLASRAMIAGWLLGAPQAAAFEDPQFPISVPLFADPADAFEGQHRDELLDLLGGAAAFDAMDTEGDVAHLVVPDGQPPGAGWGVYVHIPASADGGPRNRWDEVLAHHEMIYVGPHGAGNPQPLARRIALALDALASVRAVYPVDDDRLVLGGFSGGAAVAVMTGAHFPDLFAGTVDMCRAVMWEPHEISTIPGSIFGMGEIDHLDPAGLRSLRDHRFAFVSGDDDILQAGGEPFANYEGLLKGLGDWWARDLRARMWDVPDLGHSLAPPAAFDAALGWVLACEDEGLYPPRFDSDHRPPHTPVPTPAATPPDACDPPEEAADTGTPVARGRHADEGCGCAGAPSPLWLWLAAVAAIRVRTRGTEP